MIIVLQDMQHYSISHSSKSYADSASLHFCLFIVLTMFLMIFLCNFPLVFIISFARKRERVKGHEPKLLRLAVTSQPISVSCLHFSLAIFMVLFSD